ncbi:MAG: UbiA family prenyltransferase [Planctomycetota bacterium]
MPDPSPSDHADEPPVTLVVDLDGSLLRTDSLDEELVTIARDRPWRLPHVASRLASGRAAFKAEVGRHAALAVDRLPYREAVLDLVHEVRGRGGRAVLATAADEHIARAVADHLGCFDDHLASADGVNLKGEAKLGALRDRLGDEPFDYVGDHAADLPIWKAARRSYVVAPSKKLLAAMRGADLDVHRLGDAPGPVGPLLAAVRPKQWCKNLLLATPMLAGHAITAPNLALLAAAFVAFCAAASSVYLINDLHDLDADRGHPTKRRRPIADGRLSIRAAAIASAVLIMLAAVVSAAVSAGFVLVVLGYFAASLTYTGVIKRVALLDVVWLAGLYVYRIIAGGLAIDVFPSHWLLTFAMFFFLSLALSKRYTELRRAGDADQLARSGRGYLAQDIDLLRLLGPLCGALAVLVVCLYLNSAAVVALYPSPAWLWLAVPLLFYWIARFWLYTQRDAMTDDPVVFALTDAPTYLMVAVIAGLGMLAAWA